MRGSYSRIGCSALSLWLLSVGGRWGLYTSPPTMSDLSPPPDVPAPISHLSFAFGGFCLIQSLILLVLGVLFEFRADRSIVLGGFEIPNTLWVAPLSFL